MQKFFFMRKTMYCLLLIIVSHCTKAQVIINGIVKNPQGTPLNFVFVQAQKSPTATFTDSLGNFSLATAAGAILQFEAAGYANQTIKDGQPGANLQVVLQKAEGSGVADISTAATTISSKPLSTAYLANENISAASVSGGTLSGLAHQKGNVHGNRYLFDNFVHGFVLTPQDKIISGPTYLYNYDKIDGFIMLSINNGPVSQVNDDQIKTITLVSSNDQKVVFEKIPAIDNLHYVQVLSSGKKYKIIKQIKTTFNKSDYVNNGIASHGNDYDEFVDDAQYFVLDMPGGEKHKLSLKKKSLKEDFSKEADKLNKYMSAHNSDEIDDKFLMDLGEAMNF